VTKISILYVEDNDELRETVAELLDAEGREIVAVGDAEAALSVCEHRVFDVLLTDISLPGISGTELARRMLAARPEQWIVFCSGYDYGGVISSLGQNVRSIPKAFDLDLLDQLFDEIARALNVGRAH